jgi:hypothetical protein
MLRARGAERAASGSDFLAALEDKYSKKEKSKAIQDAPGEGSKRKRK